MPAYYNEIDPYAAQWLRNLINARVIADGEVDERSIAEVSPTDLAGFEQCHFFAGVGVWSYALRLAGWPNERPVWTGSCPCQPFSAAGKRKGLEDERHLWPEFFRLIRECRPLTVFGEQVASKDGLAWLDSLYFDLEGAGYTCGAVDTCASGFGAPHIRQRLYWLANASSYGLQRRIPRRQNKERETINRQAGCNSSTNGFWSTPLWLDCRGGKKRPTESSIFPLAHGAAKRVGRLRAYGNAIVAPQAAEFIKAAMEILP